MVTRFAALSALIAAVVVPAAPIYAQDIMGQIENQVARRRGPHNRQYCNH